MHTLCSSLRTLGIVRCEVQNKKTLFGTMVISGKVWSYTKIDGLYIVDNGLTLRSGSAGSKTSNTLHLLRSRWKMGQYANLAEQVVFDDGCGYV